MKKGVQKPKENTTQILKLFTKRLEEIAIDSHEMKRDLKFVKFGLNSVEHNTSIMKVDMEKIRNEMGEMKVDMEGMKTDITIMKKGIKEIKRDTEGLIETTAHILKQAVTLDEHNDLSQRVSALEQS